MYLINDDDDYADAHGNNNDTTLFWFAVHSIGHLFSSDYWLIPH